MTGLITISLNQLRFFAYHGLYDEEKKKGNEFEVNLSVEYEPGTALVTDISSTINYETLFRLVSREMEIQTDLLETLAMRIAGEIHAAFQQVKKISVEVVKLHPPVPGMDGRAVVRYTRAF